MKKKVTLVLIFLVTSAILAACGPSQAEGDGQVPGLAGTPVPQPVAAIDH